MGLPWLRFRSRISSPDWRVEAMEALAASDWPRFAYCFAAKPGDRRCDRLELNRPMGALGSGCLPLHLCLQSRDRRLIRQMIAAGADVDALATEAPTDCHCALPVQAGQRVPQVNAVIVSRLLDLPSDIAEELWRQSSALSRYRACLMALRLNHTAWLGELDLAHCFAAVEATFAAERHARNAAEQEHYRRLAHPDFDVAEWERTSARMLPTPEDAPLIEALRGGCPLPVIRQVWRASPGIMREAYWIESPGYGHDNDPVFAGFAIDYARYVKRDDVVAFLLSEHEAG